MNRRAMRLKFVKGDFIAIAAVAALTIASAVFFQFIIRPGEGSQVFIYQNGELVKELPLNTDTTLTLEGEYHNRIEIRRGEVGIVESDCPGADCVHTGRIHEAGRSIVCLPNRVEIRIGGDSQVDFVVK